jgi:enediyne polyketide synthase
MAQAAAALWGSLERPTFKDIEFNHPVVVSDTATLPIRLAALVRRPGVVEVVLRSAETGFQVDHFRALCEFGPSRNGFSSGANGLRNYGSSVQRMALDPGRDLYGSILFQSGRFRRLDNYRHLSALECLAEIAPDGHTAWFIHHLPGDLLLGDPGSRDAALHAIQACIPHRTVLPVAAASIHFAERRALSSEPLFISARERSRSDSTFIYDLDILGADGVIRERWRGLKLKAVGEPMPGPRHEALLRPYMERRVGDLIQGSEVSIALQRDDSPDRQLRSDRAIKAALGMPVVITRRVDGKPEAQAARSVSAAHCGDLTIAVAGPAPVGCDFEQVEDRPPGVWRALLGEARIELAQLIESRTRESGGISATRVWSAGEALKKVGAPITAPLVFVSATPDGCVSLASGKFKVVTFVTQLREREGKFVIAVLSETNSNCQPPRGEVLHASF